MGNDTTKLYDSLLVNGITPSQKAEVPDLWTAHVGDKKSMKGSTAVAFLTDVFLCLSQAGTKESRVADIMLSTELEIQEWKRILKGSHHSFQYGDVLPYLQKLPVRKDFEALQPIKQGIDDNKFLSLFEAETENRLKFNEDLFAICGVVPEVPYRVVPHTWEEIPPSVKKMIDQMGFKPSECQRHINAVWNIINFLLPDHLPSKDFQIKERIGPVSPTVSQEDLDKTQKTIQPLPQKLFLKTKFVDKGGFGQVYSASVKSYVKDGQKIRVAIKKIDHSEKNVRYNLMEIFFLSLCDHPNLVYYVSSYIHDPKKSKVEPELWVVMEYLEGGTLTTASKATLSDNHIAFIAREILRGLEYIHSKNWVHRDIKSANVMMGIKGQVKLIDFGLCADLSTGPQMCMVGSSYWIPPEMMAHDPHGLPADIWSAGVCLLELLNHSPPFGSEPYGGFKCMLAAATRGLVDQIPDTATPGARDFIKRCLARDQYERATATNLLKLPWVNQPDLGKGIDVVLVQMFLGNVLVYV